MSEHKIEDAIRDNLKGDTQVNALSVVVHLRENGMSPEWADGIWLYCNEKLSLYFLISGEAQKPGPWTLWWSDSFSQNGEIDWNSVDLRLKEVIWANVNLCENCGSGCAPGESKSVFGKAFNNVCTSTLSFTNPDAETIETIKQFIDICRIAAL